MSTLQETVQKQTGGSMKRNRSLIFTKNLSERVSLILFKSQKSLLILFLLQRLSFHSMLLENNV